MGIAEQLCVAVDKYRKLARRNYFAAYALYFLAVSASVIGTFLALVSAISGPWLAAVTAVPGAVLIVMQTFRLAERASWHYDKKNRLNALLRLAISKAPGTSEPEIAERWNGIDAEMERSWPGFGAVHTRSGRDASHST